MKIETVTIRSFKRFDNLTINFNNQALGEVANNFLLLGDNGTGKTTILQAIALCLSMVSRRTRSVEEFDWIGWMPGRYRRWGEPFIEMVVHFTDEEIDATHEAAHRWWDNLAEGYRRGDFQRPGRSRVVRVLLEGSRYSTPNDPAEMYQFQGRAYAAGLLSTDPSARELFDRLPGVFWFDQFRNLGTPRPTPEPESSSWLESSKSSKRFEESAGRVSFAVGVARLREHLNSWQLAKIDRGAVPRPHDFLMELENLYKKLFPNHSFSAPEPMFREGVPSPADYYFMISDGWRRYDIEEMSAGEQSIFPLLYEFVRQQIKNSVVLIDEIDLNLHPPLAQSLAKLLPELGPNCQFIYTTHSKAISSIVSPEEVYRLEGGQQCL